MVKACISAAAILSADGPSKHHKISAMVSLLAVNAAYGAPIARNYQLARHPTGN